MALMRPDGQVVPVLANTTPFVAGGEIVGAVGSFVDITRMKMSEESIRTLNAELAKNLVLVEDTNKELEGFVHSVTHDLRSPLVVINGFSRRLLDLAEEEFREKSHDYIEYIRETSQNALFLVRDLLRLFKIAGGEMNRTTVDLAEMSRSLRQYFGDLYPRRSLRLIVPETLTVTGDYSLLKIVMENLLDNSYKFTARNEGEAVVEIGSRRENEDLVVFVRDNGCGFDAAHAGRIFEPFSRFHKDTEYRGNGIGLATVKRIVHRHGGRIWAESRPGRGAMFCFTLPD
jgi:signal transduction histidine kinase